jgi:hypothetical protein
MSAEAFPQSEPAAECPIIRRVCGVITDERVCRTARAHQATIRQRKKERLFQQRFGAILNTAGRPATLGLRRRSLVCFRCVSPRQQKVGFQTRLYVD